jgi:tetratricopeptide (TPR) repeat protein
MVENIILGLKDNKMLMGGVFRRKGKLNFMKGSLELAEEEYEKAIEKLKDEFAYSLEYGEALNNFALLKLDQSLFTRAKDMFQKSLSILNYYYNRDTVPIQTLKKNLELV